MNRYGVIIAGTSVNPLVISIENLIENRVFKIYVLATGDIKGIKGTDIIAENTIKEFSTQYPEIRFTKVIIDRSSIDDIKNKVEQNITNEIMNKSGAEIYVDYTGGTKVQSAFIRYYFNSLKSAECHVNGIYINGFTKKINKNSQSGKPISLLKNSNNDEIIDIICRIKGFKYNSEQNEFIDGKTKAEFVFDEIYIEDFIIYFVKTMENKLETDDSKKTNKEKVKLELFKIVNDAEKIGEEFCSIIIRTPKGKSHKYDQQLSKEMLGIKRYEYKDRLIFEDEE